MKTLLLLTALTLPAAPSSGSAEERAPHGRYVEARTATVFAGACHYGAEYTLAGRDAALGFAFEGGVHDGVALAGLELAAAVSADGNLKEEGAERRTVLYVPADATPAERAALESWARAELAPLLGRVVAVEAVDVRVALDEEGRFALEAGEEVALAGNGLADLACCTMPFRRWYAPLVDVREDRVGFASRFALAVDELGVRRSRTEDNCAFFGRF